MGLDISYYAKIGPLALSDEAHAALPPEQRDGWHDNYLHVYAGDPEFTAQLDDLTPGLTVDLLREADALIRACADESTLGSRAVQALCEGRDLCKRLRAAEEALAEALDALERREGTRSTR